MAALPIAAALVAALIVHWLWQIIYNVFFHPLKDFPGPWWAGASYMTEMYFDIILGGRYFKQIEKMHARYGPMVRIGPHDLSFVDPDFAEQVYGGVGARRNRDIRQVRVSGAPTSTISTIDHDLHRIRRAPLSGFFSKQAIMKLEPLIWAKIDIFVNKLKHAQRVGKVLEALDIFGAITTDITSEYAYGESLGYLDDGPHFKNDYLRDISGLLFAGPFMRGLPFIARIMKSFPPRILVFLNSGMASIIELRRRSAEYARQTLASMEGREKQYDASAPQTIFKALADPSVPQQERSLTRLTDEGVLIMIAGLETTARFLTNLTCHLLLNPTILAKLRVELETVMPTPDAHPSWTTLENLPYLSAVINEGFRCEQMVLFRSPRVILEPLRYKDWIIPAQTGLTVSPSALNNSPDVFPDPHAFRPERWIEAKARGQNLTKYLATFGKGSRMCLGINLAYAEMFLTTAAIVRGFDMELVDSGLENIIAYRDYSFGFTKDYRFGIKVRVTKVLSE